MAGLWGGVPSSQPPLRVGAFRGPCPGPGAPSPCPGCSQERLMLGSAQRLLSTSGWWVVGRGRGLHGSAGVPQVLSQLPSMAEAESRQMLPCLSLCACLLSQPQPRVGDGVLEVSETLVTCRGCGVDGGPRLKPLPCHSPSPRFWGPLPELHVCPPNGCPQPIHQSQSPPGPTAKGHTMYPGSDSRVAFPCLPCCPPGVQ